MPYDVLVIGRPSCDLVFTGLPTWPRVGRETFARDLVVSAGGAFNVVAAMHRLGLRVGLVGVLGNDPWSRICLNGIEQEGVPTDLMLALDRPLPSVSVCMTHGGDRGFLTHEAPLGDPDRAFLAHALAVVERTSAANLQCCLTPDLPTLAGAAHARGMWVLVDCGWDEPWLGSAEMRELLPLADVVFTNEPEASAIAGEADPIAALRWIGRLVPFVVLKRGADGASAIVAGREYHAATEPVEVVDATGAGDCFNAGFLYGLHHDRPIDECLHLGNFCGGLSVAVAGGYAGAPTEAELIEHAARRGLMLATAEV